MSWIQNNMMQSNRTGGIILSKFASTILKNSRKSRDRMERLVILIRYFKCWWNAGKLGQYSNAWKSFFKIFKTIFEECSILEKLSPCCWQGLIGLVIKDFIIKNGNPRFVNQRPNRYSQVSFTRIPHWFRKKLYNISMAGVVWPDQSKPHSASKTQEESCPSP